MLNIDYLPGWSEAGITERDLTDAHPVTLDLTMRVVNQAYERGEPLERCYELARLMLFADEESDLAAAARAT